MKLLSYIFIRLLLFTNPKMENAHYDNHEIRDIIKNARSKTILHK